MSDQSASLRLLFSAALQDYEEQTGIILAKHPLAEKLQSCDSVESITAILLEQSQAFNDFRGNYKVAKQVNNAVSVMYRLSANGDFGQTIGLVRP
jgi:hypothetical protein